MAAVVVRVRVVRREAQDKIPLRAVLQETRMAVPLSRRKRNRHSNLQRKASKMQPNVRNGFVEFNSLVHERQLPSLCVSPCGCVCAPKVGAVQKLITCLSLSWLQC